MHHLIRESHGYPHRMDKFTEQDAEVISWKGGLKLCGGAPSNAILVGFGEASDQRPPKSFPQRARAHIVSLGL
jgi:hypothetical protein